MHRRALLASLAPAFAGCSLAPSGPSTDPYPTSGPNVFASFEWRPERSELRVTFDRGNRITAENTGRLVVTTSAPDVTDTVWVARDDDADPVAAFPLEPGAAVTHELPEPARTYLAWEAPEGNASRAVGAWQPETETTEDGA
jgi:hypothetical protein